MGGVPQVAKGVFLMGQSKIKFFNFFKCNIKRGGQKTKFKKTVKEGTESIKNNKLFLIEKVLDYEAMKSLKRP